MVLLKIQSIIIYIIVTFFVQVCFVNVIELDGKISFIISTLGRFII